MMEALSGIEMNKINKKEKEAQGVAQKSRAATRHMTSRSLKAVCLPTPSFFLRLSSSFLCLPVGFPSGTNSSLNPGKRCGGTGSSFFSWFAVLALQPQDLVQMKLSVTPLGNRTHISLVFMNEYRCDTAHRCPGDLELLRSLLLL